MHLRLLTSHQISAKTKYFNQHYALNYSKEDGKKFWELNNRLKFTNFFHQ